MARGTPNYPLSGPLAPFEVGFRLRLDSQGYVGGGIVGQRALVAHLDRWLKQHRLTVTDLTPEVLRRFLRARGAAGYKTKLTEHGLTPLLTHLEELELYRPPPSQATPVEEIVGRFQQHLVEERGLGDATTVNYARVGRQFLATRPAPLDFGLGILAAADVTAFILGQSERLSVPGMQTVIQGMRALLKFLYLVGLTEHELASAVPSVARRRQELPRALSEEHLERLLQGCAREGEVGIRDFAILTVLARLGLRADEVAHLELDDIDWDAGELRVRGKGPRVDKLPLPVDVGEALVDYLRRSRPTCTQRRLFISSCAPLRGLTRQAIGGLVRAAAVRAGLPAHGPHRLRHTVGTGLLRRGAPLTEIAQVLRHQSIETTVLYAKVDLEALSGLAQSWPGAAV